MPSTNKLEVTMPSDTELVVTRNFDAPRSLVYRAFTDPTLVRRWLLGPSGWTMPVCEIDLRVGGDYHYRWRNEADSSEFGLRGTYEQIEQDRILNSREHFEGSPPEGEASVATTFQDHGNGKTRVIYLITSGSKQARDAAVATGMTDGMEMSFQLLDELFASGGVA